MDRDQIVDFFAIVTGVYGLIILVAMLGGGIELSLTSPLYVSPIVLPRAALYGFTVLFFGIILTREQKAILWFPIVIGTVISILTLLDAQDPYQVAIGALEVVLAAFIILVQLGIIKLPKLE